MRHTNLRLTLTLTLMHALSRARHWSLVNECVDDALFNALPNFQQVPAAITKYRADIKIKRRQRHSEKLQC